jgi:hypothetical protein
MDQIHCTFSSIRFEFALDLLKQWILATSKYDITIDDWSTVFHYLTASQLPSSFTSIQTYRYSIIAYCLGIPHFIQLWDPYRYYMSCMDWLAMSREAWLYQERCQLLLSSSQRQHLLLPHESMPMYDACEPTYSPRSTNITAQQCFESMIPYVPSSSSFSSLSSSNVTSVLSSSTSKRFQRLQSPSPSLQEDARPLFISRIDGTSYIHPSSTSSSSSSSSNCGSSSNEPQMIDWTLQDRFQASYQRFPIHLTPDENWLTQWAETLYRQTSIELWAVHGAPYRLLTPSQNRMRLIQTMTMDLTWMITANEKIQEKIVHFSNWVHTTVIKEAQWTIQCEDSVRWVLTHPSFPYSLRISRLPIFSENLFFFLCDHIQDIETMAINLYTTTLHTLERGWAAWIHRKQIIRSDKSIDLYRSALYQARGIQMQSCCLQDTQLSQNHYELHTIHSNDKEPSLSSWYLSTHQTSLFPCDDWFPNLQERNLGNAI